ncbi:MAG: CDP-diacylglycerol--glycerol-3-phosphate 3-phosphatidyltransferase [Candidatus Hydrogenedentes bacterium]|nr:CDP-diacylglycerol--glycerol-3-phosphate 3-phosphatidyltransferase [Candidatus Hydrogenedentota bacterium]
MTLANRITLLRLLLIPVFIICVMSYTREEPVFRFVAIGVFITAALSDGLDGFIARAYNQKTRLGAVLDPLADKLLINLAFVFLAVNHEFRTPVPAWFPVVILSRDVIIVLGSYLINEYFGPLRVKPRFSGKLTTVLQLSSIGGVLLEVWFAHPLLLATLVISIVSFVDYMYAGIKQVGNEDAS